jgi:S-adenosylmethionine:tRNA-ribosyltransferase-isomerase (queuine synthetase)
MKDQKDSRRNLGFISQEVQEIFPSITHYVKESDLLTLSYTELIPILIKALQEQQDIIETQNSKIEAQITETAEQNQAIQSLIQRMERLEASNE